MKTSKNPKSPQPSPKGSSWRLCPPGYHWRSPHEQSTYSRKDGTIVHEHPVSGSCCLNPSRKDQIYSDELREIAKKYFPSLVGALTPNDLGYENGNDFDELIRGWTQFWNDTLQPTEKLDPDLVKALIGSESSFNENPKVNSLKARGLMQVTDATLKILGDPKGELKDQLLHIDQKDITDPDLNIAAGVRWLFQKQSLASAKLGRNATWDEAVANYKGVLPNLIKDPNTTPNAMVKFRKLYREIKAK